MIQINVLALCEQDIVILKPGVLYRFEPVKDCTSCARIMKAIAATDERFGKRDHRPTIQLRK